MVLRERTVSIRSVLQGWSGSGSNRGCSSAKAWATVRALSSGQERRCATSSRHTSAWRLHSASVVKTRPAQKESRTYRMALSTRPFWFPARTWQGMTDKKLDDLKQQADAALLAFLRTEVKMGKTCQYL